MKRLLLVLGVALAPGRAEAFYELSNDTLGVDLSGNLRINDTAGRLPSIDGLPPEVDRGINIVGAIGRVMAVATAGEHVSFEAHAYGLLSGQTTSPLFSALAGTTGAADGFSFSEDGRWAGLSYRPYDRAGTFAELALDRLNLRVVAGPLELTVGRQPINLATTSFFTPNDFWQPFDAQTFFRVYKPGVDAARLELELGALSRASLIGVVGFDRGLGDPEADDPVRWRESSVLARASTILFDFEWAVLGGKVPRRWVVGGALSGEVADWFGVRAEGHWAVPLDDDREGRLELSLGIERRFESSLNLVGEYFFHGAGSNDAAGYAERLTDPLFLAGPRYLGRHYAALSASYELTPLLNGTALVLVNVSDQSLTAAGYAVYSLDDEVEASFVIAIPVGEAPALDALRSERGAAPITIGAELRAYF